MKKIYIFALMVLIGVASINIKIDTKKDLIFNLKANLDPKIIFKLKEIYLFYSHNIRRKIILEKIAENVQVKSEKTKYTLTLFRNKLFKKNGPKVYIEEFDNKLITITGTGILSYASLDDFQKNTVNLKIIRNNLSNIIGLDKIEKNLHIILNMLLQNNSIFISYIDEKKKDCFSTKVLMGEMNLKNITFTPIFEQEGCVKKDNEYGEFYPTEAGGALGIFGKDQLLISTGTFRFRDLAQKVDNTFGKILLFNLINKKIKILSIGHRNTQGIFYDKNKNVIFSTDHGPQGGDEINLIFNPLNNEIKNFGYPISSYGEHYGGRSEKNITKYKKAPFHKSHSFYGFIEPHAYFVPSIAPSNIILVPSEFNKKSKDQIFMSTLGFNNDKGRRSIHSYHFDNEKGLENHEIIPLNDRVRDILYTSSLNRIFLFLEKKASIAILKSN